MLCEHIELMNLNKKLQEITNNCQRLSKEIQELGVSSLIFAKDNDLKAPTLLIKEISSSMMDELSLIRWFEDHGKIKWSKKKRRFVHQPSAKWRILKASRTPWNGDMDTLTGVSYSEEEIPQSDEEVIHLYMTDNPEPDTLGRFGVPQAKIRNGTYGLRSMVFDDWRVHVKRRR